MPKHANKHRRRGEKQARAAETRSADVLTVGWMLMVFTALVCECGFLATRWLAGAETGGTWAVLMVLLLFASTVIGVCVLLLTPVVIKARRTPPPSAVVVFSVLVGAAPWVIIVFQMMNS
jgi:predicted phage tail protein